MSKEHRRCQLRASGAISLSCDWLKVMCHELGAAIPHTLTCSSLVDLLLEYALIIEYRKECILCPALVLIYFKQICSLCEGMF